MDDERRIKLAYVAGYLFGKSEDSDVINKYLMDVRALLLDIAEGNLIVVTPESLRD